MREYTYVEVTKEPDIETGYTDPTTGEYHMTSGIHYDVPLSDMENKDIAYCTWKEEEAVLYVYWNGELSQSDLDKLDIIVQNNIPE